jgi:hypothetical protein
MKIFSDLKANQAVKLDSGVYVVELYTGAYEVNGVRTSIGYNQQLVVDSLGSIKRVTAVQGEVLYYTLGEEQVSVAEYQALNQLVAGIAEEFYNDDADEYFFSDLDTEFEFKKKQELLNRHVRVRAADTEQLDAVDITVVGEAVDTGSKFIVTPFSYGQVSFSGRGVFRVDLSAIAMDEYQKQQANYTQFKFTNTTRSNIRFAQADTNYLFKDDTLGAKENQVRVLTTLVDAKALEAEVRAVISNTMRQKLAPVALTKDIVTASGALNSLETIKSQLTKLDVKQKSYHDWVAVTNSVKKLIATLEKV